MASDDYTIRLAEPVDIRWLADVERRAVRLFEGWTRETGLTAEILGDVSSDQELHEAMERGHLWVATCDGEVVGFAQAMVLDGIAHLDEIDVVPAHTRKGVGSRLVETVCRDNAELLSFLAERLRRIPGVVSTETFVYLRIAKQSFHWSSR